MEKKPYVIAVTEVVTFDTEAERDAWAEAEARKWGLRLERNEYGDIALYDE